MPLSQSFLYMLLCPYTFPFHHSFTLPRYMNKQGNNSKPCKFSRVYYKYASHHILYNLKFCLTAYFKQMLIHMVKECAISEWLKYY
jgi:hypothetical protein